MGPTAANSTKPFFITRCPSRTLTTLPRFSVHRPDGIDWKKLVTDVRARRNERVVVVEGHLVASQPLLLDMALGAGRTRIGGGVVVLQATEALCRERRLGRRERPKEETRQLAEYFDKFVWRGYEKFLVPWLKRLAILEDAKNSEESACVWLRAGDGKSAEAQANEVLKRLFPARPIGKPVSPIEAGKR